MPLRDMLQRGANPRLPNAVRLSPLAYPVLIFLVFSLTLNAPAYLRFVCSALASSPSLLTSFHVLQWGDTPLHWAAQLGRARMCRLLIQSGQADVNATGMLHMYRLPPRPAPHMAESKLLVSSQPRFACAQDMGETLHCIAQPSLDMPTR